MIIPKDFTPRDYQKVMVEHVLRTPRCGLFVPMGMGKSSATLMALDTLALTEDVYPALVVAPLRVARSTWPEEVQKWNQFRHMGVSPIIGNAKERLSGLKQPSDIYTVNYENLPWLEQQLGNAWRFRTVVADESTKLKNFRLRQGGLRAQTLARYAHDKVKRWINLTGSPTPNGLKDLWGQLWMLDGGERLGRTYDAFEQRWFAYRRIKDAISHKDHIQTVIMPGAQEQMQERIKDICLSLNSADYFDINEPIKIPVYVHLDPPERKLYRDMEKKMFMEIEGHEIEAFNAASKTNKTLQLANGAVYVENEDETDDSAKEWKVVHDKKLDALESVIEEAAGMPILVAYNFRSDLVRLMKAFPKGRQIKSKKDEDDFKAGLIDLAFVHPASIGHGVDGFQYVTNIIVFFGMTWNLDNYDQIIQRIGPVRQIQAGFNRNVFVYHIIAKDTIDEDVLLRIESKRSVQDILLAALKRYKRT